jgi:hypothetical protein
MRGRGAGGGGVPTVGSSAPPPTPGKLATAARTLLDEAAALVSSTCWAARQAEILMSRAEVDRLAGAPAQAKASLRAALRIYQDRHATPLADQAAAALASLTGHPSAKPAYAAPATNAPKRVICAQPRA